MTNESGVLTISVGQTGVQIASSFWELICAEHAIDKNGSVVEDDENSENKSSFFQILKNNRCTPRTLLIDLEASVLDEVRVGSYRNLFNPDHLISGSEDSGGNFARGFYTVGKLLLPTICSQLRKLFENDFHVNGIVLFRSLGGGTGSGLSAAIFDSLVDLPKVTKIEVPIYPSPHLSNSIVEPYNSILSEHFCMEEVELGLLFDNQAMYSICKTSLNILKPTFNTINHLVSQTISSVTANIRFHSMLNCDLNVIQTNLVPYPRIHFPITSMAPFKSPDTIVHSRTSVAEITESVFEPINSLVSVDTSCGRYMSCSMFYRGFVSPNEVYEALRLIKAQKTIKFVDWCPTGFKISISYQKMVELPKPIISGASRAVSMLTNNSAVSDAWLRLDNKFRALFAKNAFLHWFVGEGLEETEFREAQLNIDSLIRDYLEVTQETLQVSQPAQLSPSKEIPKHSQQSMLSLPPISAHSTHGSGLNSISEEYVQSQQSRPSSAKSQSSKNKSKLDTHSLTEAKRTNHSLDQSQSSAHFSTQPKSSAHSSTQPKQNKHSLGQSKSSSLSSNQSKRNQHSLDQSKSSAHSSIPLKQSKHSSDQSKSISHSSAKSNPSPSHYSFQTKSTDESLTKSKSVQNLQSADRSSVKSRSSEQLLDHSRLNTHSLTQLRSTQSELTDRPKSRSKISAHSKSTSSSSVHSKSTADSTEHTKSTKNLPEQFHSTESQEPLLQSKKTANASVQSKRTSNASVQSKKISNASVQSKPLFQLDLTSNASVNSKSFNQTKLVAYASVQSKLGSLISNHSQLSEPLLNQSKLTDASVKSKLTATSLDQSKSSAKSINHSKLTTKSVDQSKSAAYSLTSEKSLNQPNMTEKYLAPSKSAEKSLNQSKSAAYSLTSEKSLNQPNMTEKYLAPSKSTEKSLNQSKSAAYSLTSEKSLNQPNVTEKSVAPSKSAEKSLNQSKSAAYSLTSEKSLNQPNVTEKSAAPSKSAEKTFDQSKSALYSLTTTKTNDDPLDQLKLSVKSSTKSKSMTKRSNQTVTTSYFSAVSGSTDRNSPEFHLTINQSIQSPQQQSVLEPSSNPAMSAVELRKPSIEARSSVRLRLPIAMDLNQTANRQLTPHSTKSQQTSERSTESSSVSQLTNHSKSSAQRSSRSSRRSSKSSRRSSKSSRPSNKSSRRSSKSSRRSSKSSRRSSKSSHRADPKSTEDSSSIVKSLAHSQSQSQQESTTPVKSNIDGILAAAKAASEITAVTTTRSSRPNTNTQVSSKQDSLKTPFYTARSSVHSEVGFKFDQVEIPQSGTGTSGTPISTPSLVKVEPVPPNRLSQVVVASDRSTTESTENNSSRLLFPHCDDSQILLPNFHDLNPEKNLDYRYLINFEDDCNDVPEPDIVGTKYLNSPGHVSFEDDHDFRSTSPDGLKSMETCLPVLLVNRSRTDNVSSLERSSALSHDHYPSILPVMLSPSSTGDDSSSVSSTVDLLLPGDRAAALLQYRSLSKNPNDWKLTRIWPAKRNLMLHPHSLAIKNTDSRWERNSLIQEHQKSSRRSLILQSTSNCTSKFSAQHRWTR